MGIKELVLNENNCDDYDEELSKEIEKEFPNSPFVISIDDEELVKLDEPFTDEKTIYIMDSRFDDMDYYQYDVAKMKVERIDNKPITLRQILETMIKDKHYHYDMVICDCHTFLEGFRETSNTVYEAIFGS